MVQLSICIPTRNRARYLANNLRSIEIAAQRSSTPFQVCISDNGSTDATGEVIEQFIDRLPMKVHRNAVDTGIPRNFMKVVEIADGEFTWLVGDDDLVMPDALAVLRRLISENPTVDYFYVNSYHLDVKYLDGRGKPFDTRDLPDGMQTVSSFRDDGRLPFFRLIDPAVSFDFLAGMYLSVFRRSCWLSHVDTLKPCQIDHEGTFSTLDNTIPHVKIFAAAFRKSQAFFCSRALSVNLSGAREWARMYPLVRTVRLPEVLDEYKKNGLPWLRYVRCKNFAFRWFAPDVARLLMARRQTGARYVRWKVLLGACLYPNAYLSPGYYVWNKLRERYSTLTRAWSQ